MWATYSVSHQQGPVQIKSTYGKCTVGLPCCLRGIRELFLPLSGKRINNVYNETWPTRMTS